MQLVSAAKSGVTAASSEQLSPLNPHNLFEEAFQQLSGPEVGAACSAGEDGEVCSGAAGSGGCGSSAEVMESAPLRTEMEAHKVGLSEAALGMSALVCSQAVPKGFQCLGRSGTCCGFILPNRPAPRVAQSFGLLVCRRLLWLGTPAPTMALWTLSLTSLGS